MPNTVWILGSGFSKSLGGPLLNDLLSDRSGIESAQRLADLALVNEIINDEISKEHPDEPKSEVPTPDYTWVYSVYADHLRGSEYSKNQSVHWDHAEEFLTFVDSTANNVVREALLQRWLPDGKGSNEDVATFRRHAVQAVASECHFAQVEDINADETWDPYLEWATRLNPSTDTIVTFNYDLVLEQLRKSNKVHQVHPEGVATPLRPVPAPGRVPIYKLHGSVDWFVDDKDNFSQTEDFVSAVNDGLTPLMGTPGISKRTVRNRYLTAIWERAQAALREAEVIVFLGYRSPPSDPDARSFLLKAISETEGISYPARNRRVHLVLGPDINHAAVVRMERLVDFAMAKSKRAKRHTPGYAPTYPKYQVIKQPLYVEDFLSVYYDRELNGPDYDYD